MAGPPNPTKLMSYEGHVTFTKMECYNKQSMKLDTSIQHPTSTTVGNMRETLDTIGDPKIYKKETRVGKSQSSNELIKENLYTKGREYYYQDGTEYIGDYHRHGDFQAMTGAVHSNTSEKIYIKNGAGEIEDPNDKKRLKELKYKLRGVL